MPDQPCGCKVDVKKTIATITKEYCHGFYSAGEEELVLLRFILGSRPGIVKYVWI